MSKIFVICPSRITNILCDKDKISGVLDFDDACYTFLIFDLGTLIYYWAWLREKKLNLKKANYLLKEYGRYRKLSKIEKEHIFDALKMVILTYMAWFFYEKSNSMFEESRKKLEEIDEIGRKEFYKKLF